MKAFNLITEPWIICIDHRGNKKNVSLADLFSEAHTYIGLGSEEAIVDGGLYRLLLAILARVFGPKNYYEWEELFISEKFDMGAILEYFEKFQNHFFLFDDQRPFYQCRDERVKPKTPLKMMPHLASGNNVTLFNHNTESEGISLTSDQGARFLIALQYYGLGGLSGIDEKFTAAPSCRGISFFVLGKNLFETLVLNMIRYTGDDDRPIPSDGTGEDKPSWEMDDPFQERDEPYGLLDYLTWQNRRILLIPTIGEESIKINHITEAPGLRMSSDYLDGVRNRDPYQYYYRGSKNQPFVLRFQLEREVWRNSATILRNRDDLAPPENIRWLQELSRAGIMISSHTGNLEALGMVSDKAKVYFYKRDNYPLPLQYIENDDLVLSLERQINIAEEISISLNFAVEKIATYLPNYDQKENGGNKKEKGQIREHLNAGNIYWSKLEPGFVDLITHLPRDVVLSEVTWQETVRAAAREALEHALRLAGTSAGALKAGVHARAILEKNIREKLPLLYKEVTNE